MGREAELLGKAGEDHHRNLGIDCRQIGEAGDQRQPSSPCQCQGGDVTDRKVAAGARQFREGCQVARHGNPLRHRCSDEDQIAVDVDGAVFVECAEQIAEVGERRIGGYRRVNDRRIERNDADERRQRAQIEDC